MMIPTSLIFEQSASTVERGNEARKQALSLFWFLVIGAGVATVYAFVASAFVSAFPMVNDWVMRGLVIGSLVVPAYMMHRRFCFAASVSDWQALPRYVAVQAGLFSAAVLFSQLAYGVAGMPSGTVLFLVFVLTVGLNHRVVKLWAFAQD